MMKSFYQCAGCGSKMTDAQLEEARQTNPQLISCCPDRSMELRLDNGHSLYQSKDFTSEDANENGPLYRNVVDGGLAVCKVCGDYGAGLAQRCRGYRKNGEIAGSPRHG